MIRHVLFFALAPAVAVALGVVAIGERDVQRLGGERIAFEQAAAENVVTLRTASALTQIERSLPPAPPAAAFVRTLDRAATSAGVRVAAIRSLGGPTGGDDIVFRGAYGATLAAALAAVRGLPAARVEGIHFARTADRAAIELTLNVRFDQATSPSGKDLHAPGTR